MNLSVITLISYLIMILLNALANIIPINGVDTGLVSDSYFNLFAPAGITFVIWGLIYLLLGIFTLYQLDIKGTNKLSHIRSIDRIRILFSINALANSIWIIAWHYFQIGISLILMLIILISLIAINRKLNKEKLSKLEKIYIKLPFGIYFGWITVATIANITTFLVSVNWTGFGISENIWTVIIIIVGGIIGSLSIINYKSFSYGLVIIWAYIGILIKHISESGFNRNYPDIIIATIVMILVLCVIQIYGLIKGKIEVI